MKKINSIFKILEDENIPSAMLWDEILRVKIASKLAKLSDDKLLKDEGEYKSFLKTTKAMGLSGVGVDRVVFNKIFELCENFSLIELTEVLNKKYFKKFDFYNINFLNFSLTVKKSVFIPNSMEYLKFLEDFIKKNKNNEIYLGVDEIHSKIILDLLFHEFKNVKIIFENNLNCDFIICNKNYENYLNRYNEAFYGLFEAKFLSGKNSEKIRKKIIDENNISEISIFENKNTIFLFKINKNKSNKIKINVDERVISKNKKEIIRNYSFNFVFYEYNCAKTKIGKIAEVKRGISLGDFEEGEIPLINLSDLDNFYVNLKNAKKINIQEKFIEKYKVKKGDILISARGTKIKAAIFSDEIETIFSSNLILIRPNCEKIIPEFLAAIFQNDIGKNILNKIQRGKNVINLNPQDVKCLEIPLPEIKTQEKIANNYRKIHDKLIEAQKETEKMSNELHKAVFTD